MKERRSHLLLMGLILVALVGVALLAVPGSPVHRKATLGLDLQGGLEVVKKAVPEKGQTVDSEGMDDAVSIIRSRIDSVGAFEPEIRQQGTDQIVIELPGVRDQRRATELIGQTAKLELYDLQGNLIPGASLDTNGNPIARDNLFDLLSSQQGAAKSGASAYYLLKETGKGKQKTHELVVGPKPTREAILASPYVKKNKAEGKELPDGTKIYAVPENMVVITCGKTERYCPGVQQDQLNRTYYYLFKYDPDNKENPVPEMTGDDLKRKGTRQDFDSGPGRGNEPVNGSLALLDMTPYGRREAWQDDPDGWPEAIQSGAPVGGHGAPISVSWRTNADGVPDWGPTSRPAPQWTRPCATPAKTLGRRGEHH